MVDLIVTYGGTAAESVTEVVAAGGTVAGLPSPTTTSAGRSSCC
jgi:hypothetical protein